MKVTFRALPDITAYEVATLLPLVLLEGMTLEKWDALGDSQRHFTRHPCDKVVATKAVTEFIKREWKCTLLSGHDGPCQNMEILSNTKG